jgi:hypothetical protein
MGVPRMTASMYRKHTLFSGPYYDDKLEGWMPYARVVQDVLIDGDKNNVYHHEMKNLNQSKRCVSASSVVAVGLTNISPMRQ